MGEFEDKMHSYSLDEAESKLLWSKPNGFFGERLFKAVYEAAQYYRSEKRENELLRGALSNLTEQIQQLQADGYFLEELEDMTIDGESIPWSSDAYELGSRIDRLADLVDNYATDLNPNNWAN